MAKMEISPILLTKGGCSKRGILKQYVSYLLLRSVIYTKVPMIWWLGWVDKDPILRYIGG